MKRLFFVVTFLCVACLVVGGRGFCLEDCFNYEFIRQDLNDKYGWEVMDAWKNGPEGTFSLEKRWPTCNLQLTPEEEQKRFGTTGLKLMQKEYLAFHSDGSSMRMFTYIKIVHPSGTRKVAGYRAEDNPAMPSEYLDLTFPEEKKTGQDWFMMLHWITPADIRGTGIYIKSPNNKAQENDTWVWFPSLRKARRLTPASGGDAMAGSDVSFAESFLWRLTDETFQIIGETKYKNFCPVDYFEGLYFLDKYGPLTKEYVEFYKGTVAQPRDCWVVRSKSIKGGYADWYDTRITIMDKEWGVAYGWEIYNPKHKLMRSASYYWRRASDYNGKVVFEPFDSLFEALNFEDWGFSYLGAPQTVHGCPVPEEWDSLRELQKSVSTSKIPYMHPLPPTKLAPLEELYPPEMIEARKKFLPQGRITSFPNADTELIGFDKWESESD